MIKRFKYLCLVFVFCLSLMPIAHVQARPIPGSFADLAETVSPAVVNVSTTQFPKEIKSADGRRMPRSPFQFEFDFGPEGGQQNPFNGPFKDLFEEFFNGPMPGMPDMGPHGVPMPRSQSLGSGFVIDAQKGYIITNNHVVEGADEIQITLQDDETLKAELVGRDAKTDLAVLKVDPSKHKLVAVPWGDSTKMRVGDWVLAVGNPFGLGGTVTAGIISARQRNINAGPYDDFIQTDASINRGNSGGPMFNMDGQVIGINTAIFSPSGGSVGIGFAIPSDLARNVIDQLVEYGSTRRGWLGVQIQEVTDDIADSLGLNKAKGALVAGITPKGPADKAGLKAGDIIIGFDGKDVVEMRYLPRIVAETDINKEVDVTVWRQNKEVTTKVTLGQLEKAEEDGLIEKTLLGQVEEPKEGKAIDKLGFDAAPLDDTLRTQFSLDKDVKGLVITDIDIRSDAAEKGLVSGDVIVEANQTPVSTIKNLETAVQSTLKSGKKSMLLLIDARGTKRFIAVKLEDLKEEE